MHRGVAAGGGGGRPLPSSSARRTASPRPSARVLIGEHSTRARAPAQRKSASHFDRPRAPSPKPSVQRQPSLLRRQRSSTSDTPTPPQDGGRAGRSRLSPQPAARRAADRGGNASQRSSTPLSSSRRGASPMRHLKDRAGRPWSPPGRMPSPSAPGPKSPARSRRSPPRQPVTFRAAAAAALSGQQQSQFPFFALQLPSPSTSPSLARGRTRPDSSSNGASPRPCATGVDQLWVPVSLRGSELSVVVGAPDGDVARHALSPASTRLVLEHWRTPHWLIKSQKQGLVVRRDAAQTAHRARTLLQDFGSKPADEQQSSAASLIEYLHTALDRQCKAAAFVSEENASLREQLAAAQAAADGFRELLQEAEAKATQAPARPAAQCTHPPGSLQAVCAELTKALDSGDDGAAAAAARDCVRRIQTLAGQPAAPPEDPRAVDVYRSLQAAASAQRLPHEALLKRVQDRCGSDVCLALSQLESGADGTVARSEWLTWCAALGAIGQSPAATLDAVQRCLEADDTDDSVSSIVDPGSPPRPAGTLSVSAVFNQLRGLYSATVQEPDTHCDRVRLLAALRSETTQCFQLPVAAPTVFKQQVAAQLRQLYDEVDAGAGGEGVPAKPLLQQLRLRSALASSSWHRELRPDRLLCGVPETAEVTWGELQLRAAAESGGCAPGPAGWWRAVLDRVLGGAAAPTIRWVELSAAVCAALTPESLIPAPLSSPAADSSSSEVRQLLSPSAEAVRRAPFSWINPAAAAAAERTTTSDFVSSPSEDDGSFVEPTAR
eukprot:TRINITY_DN3893_c1_g2_i1.p1 TRINITY_DN3893_c1_g2~~TRINITY_DN3893_c1_g2_i1.p1  ORF type:complete len:778 (+),score=256.47 TRINITY_DN3893_c1_g2_i1:107-2440(+)